MKNERIYFKFYRRGPCPWTGLFARHYVHGFIKMDKLAEKYGFKIEKSGFKYSKGTRHVWLVFLGWQTADLKGQCLANYKKFKTLEEALKRP